MTTSIQPRTQPNSSEAIPGQHLSVVIPLLNEAENLPELLDELLDAFEKLHGYERFEIIFVDDGSTDRSYEILESQFHELQMITVIRFRRNFGKSAALSAGFSAARGDVVVTMDADLQDVPAEMPRLVAPITDDTADLVSGWKTPRQDPWTKTAPSALFNRTVRAVTGIPLHDFNCGFKAYRRDVLSELHLYGEMHRYIPVLAYYRGFRIAEVPVQHRARRHGTSKFGLERYFRGFFDLLTVLFLNHYTRRPLHLFGWIGFVAFGAGLLINLYLTILKLGFGEPIGNRPLLTLGVLLMLIGAMFFVFGLLGEMIAYQTRVSLGRSSGASFDYSVRSVLDHEDSQRE